MTATKLRTFRIGSPRPRGEGLRIGTVRYLPRGVRKDQYAERDHFDVWLPLLAPSRELLQWLHDQPADKPKTWTTFFARYRREMTKSTDSRQTIQLLARLAAVTPLAIGCYCEDETRCHRSVLRELIAAASARSPRPAS